MTEIKLWLVDCISGKAFEISDDPFLVGSAPSCHLYFSSSGDPVSVVSIRRGDGGYDLEGVDGMIFDGKPLELVSVSDTEAHSLVIQGYPLALRIAGADGKRWVDGFNTSLWWLLRPGATDWEGPVEPWEVPMVSSSDDGDVAVCTGFNRGFFSRDIGERLSETASLGQPAMTESDEAEETSSESEISNIDTEYGEYTCPICWIRFDVGDLMNIAVHASLRGDPILGEEYMQRFLASRFNDKGQALDPMGVPAPEIACPHCRRKLPQGFTEEPHHIFSIVGAPTSGKSYYLSVLVKQLQSRLFRDFGVSFRDASPSENAVLNDMKRHLFGAGSPQDAYLAKTDLEGALYERLPRQGRQVMLPKPFVFRVTDTENSADSFSAVFYDNAGEHFEPGQNSADSPGAQHIAVASGVLFLLDPLFNTEFRHRLKGISDPQLERKQPDQQDVILSELEARIKEILGLQTNEKISTPIAVMVGKSDAWRHLIEGEPLAEIVEHQDGQKIINLGKIKSNSDRIRSLLVDVCPAIVSNVESISTEIRYFAVSSLGHAPIKFTDSDGVERIGPDPAQLKPDRVEEPILWIASLLSDLFPSVK